MQLRPHKRRSSVVINVTSLVDIMFNLLLFFMVSTSFISSPALKLELPTAKHAEIVQQKPIVVYIDKDSIVYLNDEPLDISLLGAALVEKIAGSQEKSVILKADSRVTHGTVVQVLDAIKGAGATRLVISTQPAK
jgi:biopolymer transport protein ExbD